MIFIARQNFLRETLSHLSLLLGNYLNLEHVRDLFTAEVIVLVNFSDATDFLIHL
jgi:hypothetical protein